MSEAHQLGESLNVPISARRVVVGVGPALTFRCPSMRPPPLAIRASAPSEQRVKGPLAIRDRRRSERRVTASCRGGIHRKQPFRFSKRLYKLRWRIESAFNRLKDFRRIATRYDRLARNYLASVCLAAALVWWI
jgi:transposase